MVVRLNAAESRSWSITASVLTNSPEGLVLTYLFDNDPEAESVRTMQRFRGTTVLVSAAPTGWKATITPVAGERRTGHSSCAGDSPTFVRQGADMR